MSKQQRPQHDVLMRRMGSPTGEWNPLPPDQHLFSVRFPDIPVAPLVRQSVEWVQWKTVDRMKGCEIPQTRTPQTRDDRGDLNLSAMAEYFGWDLSNASKIAGQAEELGFYHRDEKGIFHLNAVVMPAAERRTKGETEKSDGMYKPLPPYLNAQTKGLSEKERSDFIQGWVAAERWEDEALAQAKVEIYRRKIERQHELCRQAGIEMKTAGGRPREERPEIVQLTFVLAPDADRFIQTTAVQTNTAGTYEAADEFVPDDVSLFASSENAEDPEKLASELSEEGNEEPTESPIAPSVRDAIARSKLTRVGDRQPTANTVPNICGHLQQLTTAREVREVLDVLEDRCRFLATRPAEANSKTWGWLVGVVKSEVETRLEVRAQQKPKPDPRNTYAARPDPEAEDLRRQALDLAKAKTMKAGHS